MLELRKELRKPFEQNLAKQNEIFDTEVMLLKTRRSSQYGYHTNLRNCDAHMTRDSLYYAVALLDRNREGDVSVAEKILDKVLDLQDLDKESATYGIWPWYAEEPIHKMPAPDWNWADFCGKALLHVLVDHRERICPELLQRVETAVEAAAYSIVKRNVSPAYTNISIMGTYVILLAGEALNHKELLDYGRERLKNLYYYNLHNGAFNEFNSPTYTVVAIEDLTLMLHYIKDKEAVKMIRELNDMAWASVAQHFHAVTNQWSGPHSRCYSTLQGKRFLSLIQLATGGKVRFMEEEELDIDMTWVRMNFSCPEKYLYYFINPNETAQYRQVICHDEPSIEATTYITPEYTLGTFDRSDLWNQRRPLVAYWGDDQNPSYMRVRCIHEDYDYCSAVLNCLQDRNLILGAMNFSMDHGDRHITLDKIIDGKIQASYLSVRFEFGGDVNSLQMPDAITVGIPFLVTTATNKIGFVLKEAFFDGQEIRIRPLEENGLKCFDIVLYEGPSREMDFTKVKEACAAFGILFEGREAEEDSLLERLGYINTFRKTEKLDMTYQDPYKELVLSIPVKPGRYSDVMLGHEKRETLKIESSDHVWVINKKTGR